MELTGKLKKQVESETTREGRREVIKKAGILLTDEELEKVAGGFDEFNGLYFGDDSINPYFLPGNNNGGTENNNSDSDNS